MSQSTPTIKILSYSKETDDPLPQKKIMKSGGANILYHEGEGKIGGDCAIAFLSQKPSC